MDYINEFVKKEKKKKKRIGDSDSDKKNIHPGYKNGIWY